MLKHNLPRVWARGVDPRGAAAAALGFMLAVAIVILWRRLAGALVHPLLPGAFLAAGVAVVAAAAAIRIGWRHGAAKRRSRWAGAMPMGLVSLAAVALLASLWLPGTSLVTVLAVAALLAVEEAAGWTWHSRRGGADISVCREHQSAFGRQKCLPHRPEPAAPGENVVQQLTRVRTADDAEELRGWLHVAFAAGQRTASAHVAFCPPLAVTPEVAVEQADGPEARIKTGQLLPYGVRIDLKLAAPAEEAGSVLLEFVARASGS